MKLHWKNVVICYLWMIYLGAAAWVYCAWSFKGIWKGCLIGVTLFTVFLLWMAAEEWFYKFKSNFSWHKFKNLLKSK